MVSDIYKSLNVLYNSFDVVYIHISVVRSVSQFSRNKRNSKIE